MKQQSPNHGSASRSPGERVGLVLLLMLTAVCLLALTVLALAGEPKSAFYVPVGLLALAGITIFVSGPRRAQIALVLVIIAPAPWIAESLVGWLDNARQAKVQHARRRYSEARGIAFDSRGRREVVENLRKQGVDAWPAVHPATLLQADTIASRSVLRDSVRQELLPLGGIAGVDTVYGNEEGRYLIYRSDEHGFHNPPGLWSLPRIDVAVLGDSFAHGASVPSHRNLVAVVRRRWPATLNLGYGGNGPLIELATLLEYLPRRRPRVVLWVLCEVNDLGEDLEREIQSPLLRRYWEEQRPIQDLEKRQPVIDAALRDYVAKLTLRETTGRRPQRSSTLALVALDRVRQTAFSAASGPRIHWDAFSDVLRRARDIVRTWDGALYLVYLPVHYTVQSGWPHRRRAEQRRRRILEISPALGIGVIDVEQVFIDSGSRLQEFVYPYPAHFTSAGYEAAGQAIVERLEHDGW